MAKKKLNDGCLKIFHFLKLLYNNEADYKNVLEIFKDDIDEDINKKSNNAQVVLNKYINTLRIYGIKVVKQDNKFQLKSSLYSMRFTLEDLKSISLLVSSIQEFPDGDITNNVNEFLNKIHFRMNNEDKNKFGNLTPAKAFDFEFKYLDIREQLEQCKSICKDTKLVRITYLQKDKEFTSRCFPREIIYSSKSASLKVWDSKKQQIIEIDIPNILAIDTTPQINNTMEIGQTVFFKLKGRLAKNYKIKENETYFEKKANGDIVILNKDETPEKLLRRLMRYSYNCEIISPKSLRDDFLELVNSTLSNYD